MSDKEFKIVGKSIPPLEVFEKVTGRFQYVDDLPAELYAKILRSPHAHARIRRIDTSKVERLPGVVAILTPDDVPSRQMPRRDQRCCYILEDHVRYAGDEVAAVAARTRAIAEEALDLFDVEYEVLPAIFDPEEGSKPDAPQLYPGGNVYGPQLAMLVEKNIHAPMVMEWGEIEEGFKESDVVIEDKVEVKPQIHSPVEPHICIASWKGDELTILTATQSPYELRLSVAYALGIPESKVRVISPAIGGGFGAKYVERLHAIAALLSKKAGGRSTKVLYTREEEQCNASRAGAKITVKIGAKKDGTLTAIHLKAFFGIGAYGNLVGGSVRFSEEIPSLAYKYPNARFEAWDVNTNHFTCQPCRGVAIPTYTYAIENVIDQVAEELGMNPVEFRLKNMPESGEMMPLKPHKNPLYPNAKLDVYPVKQILMEVANKIGWQRFKGFGQPIAVDGPKQRGISIISTQGWGGFCIGGTIPVTVVLNNDASIQIISGHHDLGTGSNVTLRQIAAEALGISIEEVTIVSGDTSLGHFHMTGARGSRSLTTTGHFILEAIEEAKRRIRKIAGPMLSTEPEKIEISGKRAYLKDREENGIPLSKILTSPMICSAGADPGEGKLFYLVTPEEKSRNPFVQGAEVEVDIETGEVKPIKIVTGNCPGRMINPMIVRGQYNGGATMTLGMALWEEFNYDEENSVYTHASFTDYKVPRALDVPPIENVIVEEVVDRPLDVGTPFGAKGVGEAGSFGGLASMASAIYNATGARMKLSPMTAERVLEGIKQTKKGK